MAPSLIVRLVAVRSVPASHRQDLTIKIATKKTKKIIKINAKKFDEEGSLEFDASDKETSGTVVTTVL